MPLKATAHDRLAKLEQRVVDATQALRDAEARSAAAEVAVETARDAVRECHDLGSDPSEAIEALKLAKRDAEQAALGVEGVARRVDRAERDVAGFRQESGLQLLEERAPGPATWPGK